MIIVVTKEYENKSYTLLKEYQSRKINSLNREKQLKWWLRSKKNELVKSVNPNRDDLWCNRF